MSKGEIEVWEKKSIRCGIFSQVWSFKGAMTSMKVSNTRRMVRKWEHISRPCVKIVIFFHSLSTSKRWTIFHLFKLLVHTLLLFLYIHLVLSLFCTWEKTTLFTNIHQVCTTSAAANYTQSYTHIIVTEDETRHRQRPQLIHTGNRIADQFTLMTKFEPFFQSPIKLPCIVGSRCNKNE